MKQLLETVKCADGLWWQTAVEVDEAKQTLLFLHREIYLNHNVWTATNYSKDFILFLFFGSLLSNINYHYRCWNIEALWYCSNFHWDFGLNGNHRYLIWLSQLPNVRTSEYMKTGDYQLLHCKCLLAYTYYIILFVT